jgi:hypothetical protein
MLRPIKIEHFCAWIRKSSHESTLSDANFTKMGIVQDIKGASTLAGALIASIDV